MIGQFIALLFLARDLAHREHFRVTGPGSDAKHRALGLMWAIAFEEQSDTLAPIDAIFLEILKAVAFMGVGTLGGISGRKASQAVAKKMSDKGED